MSYCLYALIAIAGYVLLGLIIYFITGIVYRCSATHYWRKFCPTFYKKTDLGKIRTLLINGYIQGRHEVICKGKNLRKKANVLELVVLWPKVYFTQVVPALRIAYNKVCTYGIIHEDD